MIIPSDTANSDVIRIEGDPKGVKAAKQQLLEIASKMVITLLLSACVLACTSTYICRFVHEALFLCDSIRAVHLQKFHHRLIGHK